MSVPIPFLESEVASAQGLAAQALYTSVSFPTLQSYCKNGVCSEHSMNGAAGSSGSIVAMCLWSQHDLRQGWVTTSLGSLLPPQNEETKIPPPLLKLL